MGKVFGYARVSTQHQNIERQVRNILSIDSGAKIYQESWTGTEMNRPEWNKLLRVVQSGDVIVFDSVSRMARTAKEGVRTYTELMEHGVELQFIREPHINTRVFKEAMGRIVLPKVETGQEATDKLIGTIMNAVQVYVQDVVAQQVQIAFEQAEKEVTDLRVRTREGIETARRNGKNIGRPVGSGKGFETEKERKCLPMIKKMAKCFDGNLSDMECIEVLGLARGTYYKYKAKIKEDLSE